MKRTFMVKAVWDEDAQVFYAESDIEGLHIEAADLDEFEELIVDAAPELITTNHRTTRQDRGRSVRCSRSRDSHPYETEPGEVR